MRGASSGNLRLTSGKVNDGEALWEHFGETLEMGNCATGGLAMEIGDELEIRKNADNRFAFLYVHPAQATQYRCLLAAMARMPSKGDGERGTTVDGWSETGGPPWLRSAARRVGHPQSPLGFWWDVVPPVPTKGDCSAPSPLVLRLEPDQAPAVDHLVSTQANWKTNGYVAGRVTLAPSLVTQEGRRLFHMPLGPEDFLADENFIYWSTPGHPVLYELKSRFSHWELFLLFNRSHKTADLLAEYHKAKRGCPRCYNRRVEWVVPEAWSPDMKKTFRCVNCSLVGEFALSWETCDVGILSLAYEYVHGLSTSLRKW